MKKIFVIDWCLLAAFVASACTGVGLHIAGNGYAHEVWHEWAVWHVLTSTLFLVAAALHVATHWRWYQSITKKRSGRKSKVTLLLSVTFALTAGTGIALLGVSGANSDIGLWHYRLGLFVALLSLGHILKRTPALRQSIKKKQQMHGSPRK